MRALTEGTGYYSGFPDRLWLRPVAVVKEGRSGRFGIDRMLFQSWRAELVERFG